MVSSFPRLFAVPDAPTEPTPRAEGFGERVLAGIREAFCGLHGHDSMLRFEQERLCLKCVSCGHESPGWELNQTPPHVVARVEPRRQAHARPGLVATRQIA